MHVYVYIYIYIHIYTYIYILLSLVFPMRQVLRTVRNVTQLDSLTNSAAHIPLGERKEATEGGGMGGGGLACPRHLQKKKKGRKSAR